LKIVFLNRYFSPDHSATSQLLADLALDLARRGMEIVVLTSRQVYDNPDARLLANETVAGVQVARLWTTRFGRSTIMGRAIDYGTFYLSAFLHLLLQVKREDTVVAKTDPPLISVVASWVVRRKGAKLVNWLQDLFPEVAVELGLYPWRGRAGQVLRRLRNYSLMAAACNVVVGEQMRRRLIGEGVVATRVTVIHNWSDGRSVYPVEPLDNPLRKEWGLTGKFVVGYSGNMGRAHGFDALLEAAAILRQREDIAFLFVGDGARRQWVEQQVQTRSLNNVLLRPYQPRERLAESLSVPDIHFISLKPAVEGLIVPSKFYGVIAAGRAIVFAGARDGDVANMIREAECGKSVELDDAQGMAYLFEQLADDPERCRWLGQNARESFEQCYGMEKSIGAWHQVLCVQ
jgi:colanic acid biosynthesis glycosyl transferase WcaI